MNDYLSDMDEQHIRELELLRIVQFQHQEQKEIEEKNTESRSFKAYMNEKKRTEIQKERTLTAGEIRNLNRELREVREKLIKAYSRHHHPYVRRESNNNPTQRSTTSTTFGFNPAVTTSSLRFIPSASDRRFSHSDTHVGFIPNTFLTTSAVDIVYSNITDTFRLIDQNSDICTIHAY